MNYLTEINAFYQRQETNPLSPHATCLWHALMQVNNRTNWKKTFTVAVSVLCAKANVTESSFKRARIELRDKGYLHYQSRRGNQAAMYQVVTAEEYRTNEACKENVPLTTEEPLELTSKQSDNVSALVKQDLTKQITTTAAHVFFETNIGEMRPLIFEELTDWVNALGDELVVEAMKRSVDRGKANWGYIKAILKSWLEKDITCVADTEQELKEHQTKQKRRPDVTSNEVIPDWFHERGKIDISVTKVLGEDDIRC